MLKIGGECRQCINWDETLGCKIIDTIAMTRNDDDVVYCIDGIEAEGEGE